MFLSNCTVLQRSQAVDWSKQCAEPEMIIASKKYFDLILCEESLIGSSRFTPITLSVIPFAKRRMHFRRTWLDSSAPLSLVVSYSNLEGTFSFAPRIRSTAPCSSGCSRFLFGPADLVTCRLCQTTENTAFPAVVIEWFARIVRSADRRNERRSTARSLSNCPRIVRPHPEFWDRQACFQRYRACHHMINFRIGRRNRMSLTRA